MRRGITAAALSVAILAPGCGGNAAPDDKRDAHPAAKIEAAQPSETDQLIESQLVYYMGRIAKRAPQVTEGKPIKSLTIKGLEVELEPNSDIWQGPHLWLNRMIGKFGEDKVTTNISLDLSYQGNDPRQKITAFSLSHSIDVAVTDKKGKVDLDVLRMPFPDDEKSEYQTFDFEKKGAHWTAKDCERIGTFNEPICTPNKSPDDIEAIFDDMSDSLKMLVAPAH